MVQQLRDIAQGHSPSAIFAGAVRDGGSTTITFDDPEYERHDPDASFRHSNAQYPGVVVEVKMKVGDKYPIVCRLNENSRHLSSLPQQRCRYCRFSCLDFLAEGSTETRPRGLESNQITQYELGSLFSPVYRIVVCSSVSSANNDRVNHHASDHPA